MTFKNIDTKKRRDIEIQCYSKQSYPRQISCRIFTGEWHHDVGEDTSIIVCYCLAPNSLIGVFNNIQDSDLTVPIFQVPSQ